MKNSSFSQAERKKVIICRERVFDVRFRVGDVAAAMEPRGMDAGEIKKFLPALSELDEAMEKVEKDNGINC